jgi:orotidine 5'-phosphate decarboxylase subfamily 2
VTERAGFVGRLYAAAARNNSLVCVGLDPELEKLPAHLRDLPQPIFEFNRRIVDATAEFACCYKPQFAHYAALGAEDQLLATIHYIHEKHPGLPVILDSKRGDIGSTAAKYAQESFERYGADAVTVNPYLGSDSVEPYLKWADRGVIILCRTSNPGARDFQDLESGGKRLYRHVAERVARDWNAGGQSWRRFARWQATCRSWCPVWVRRVVMWRLRCVLVARQMDWAWCSIHRAASSMRAAAKALRMQRVRRRVRSGTRSTATDNCPKTADIGAELHAAGG